MKNERLVNFMEAKGITKTQLSRLTNIPMTTLNRIINGDVQKIKMSYMEAIAASLGTSIYYIFDLPAMEFPLTSALRPDEAGTVVANKILQPEESLLLYWYQNSLQESRAAILNKAKAEYYLSQKLVNEKLNSSVPSADQSKDNDENYVQLTFPL